MIRFYKMLLTVTLLIILTTPVFSEAPPKKDHIVPSLPEGIMAEIGKSYQSGGLYLAVQKNKFNGTILSELI